MYCYKWSRLTVADLSITLIIRQWYLKKTWCVLEKESFQPCTSVILSLHVKELVLANSVLLLKHHQCHINYSNHSGHIYFLTTPNGSFVSFNASKAFYEMSIILWLGLNMLLIYAINEVISRKEILNFSLYGLHI